MNSGRQKNQKRHLTHPEMSELAAFASGSLVGPDFDYIAEHLLSCETCCQLLTQKDADEDRLLGLARAAHQISMGDTLIQQTSTASHQGDLKARRMNSDADVPTLLSGFNLERLSDVSPALEIPPGLRNHARYEVLSELGKGGMGVVYRARHRMMQRDVALKVISARYTSNRLAIERFQQEVRAAAKLSHPNIVAAFDAEQAGDVHFLVMEFIAGKSLLQLVQERGPLPVQECCEFIRQACLGLQHAHDQGMVHRDIKPQNLMVTPPGQLRILDFGLARLECQSGDVSPTTKTAMNLTAVGMVLGTPDFMAPEQLADARSADARSDIYSLGCTLFYLLTGKTPFGAGSFSEMLAANTPGSLLRVMAFRPDAPRELVRLLERMTHEDPAKRFRSMAEVAIAIQPLCGAEKTSNQSSPELQHHSENLAPNGNDVGGVSLPLQKTQQRSESQRPVPVRAPVHDEPKRGRKRRAAKSGHSTFAAKPKLWHVRFRTGIILAAMTALPTIYFLVFDSPETSVNSTGTSSQTPEFVPKQIDPRDVTERLPVTSVAPPLASSDTNKTTFGVNPENQLLPAAASGPLRILVLVPSSDFQWSDLTPFRRFEQEDTVRITVTSWTSEVAELNRADRRIPVGIVLADVDPDQFGAVVIVGGAGLIYLTNANPEHDTAELVIRQFLSAGKPVGAAGAGPGVLASMKLLENVPATGHPLIHDDVRTRFSIDLQSSPFIRSGQILTARDINSLSQLIDELLAGRVPTAGKAAGEE